MHSVFPHLPKGSKDFMDIITIHLDLMYRSKEDDFLRSNTFILFLLFNGHIDPPSSLNRDQRVINFTILLDGFMVIITMHPVLPHICRSRQESVLKISFFAYFVPPVARWGKYSHEFHNLDSFYHSKPSHQKWQQLALKFFNKRDFSHQHC